MRTYIIAAAGFAAVASAAYTAAAPVKTYSLCQSATKLPLEGCPEGTLFVSQTNAAAHFRSIQSAIDSLGNSSIAPAHILIDAGNYTEQLNVTRAGPLTLLGVSELPRLGASYANRTSSTLPAAANAVQIWWNSANNNASFPDNAYTSVLTVAPNLNASLTGAGPTGFSVPDDTPVGSSDFRAYNIDFRNEWAPRASGPAHAVGVSRATASFYSCGLYSYQDTLYVGKLGRAFFWDSVVAGQTDFLYGFGTLWLSRSTLSLRGCGGGITAWKGTNTTAPNRFGVYVADSQVLAANETVKTEIKGRCALGRPWNAQHRSVFIRSYFDESIRSSGYVQWSTSEPRVNNSTFMAVWEDYGPGWDESGFRASNVTLVLDQESAAPYSSPQTVFLDGNALVAKTEWIDKEALPAA